MALNPGLGNIGAGAGRNPLNPGLGNIGGNKRPTINPSIGNKGIPGFADNLNFYTGEAYNSAVLKGINNALSDNRLLGLNLPDKVVTPVRKWTQRLDDKSTLYSDMYAPDQVNSVLDVILKAIDPLENNGSFFKTAFRGGVDLMDQLLWKPLVHGDVWAFALNNLTNLGETVDVLANGVKAVVSPNITTASSEYGLTKENSTWVDRLKLAYGYGVQGRYQFDYDLDPNSVGKDLIPNILLEVVSDPINWLTLGSKAVMDLSVDAGLGAAKGVTKIGSDLATSAGLKNADEFVTFFNRFKKPIINAYMHNDGNAFRNILSNVWESFAKSNTIEDFSKAKSKYIAAVSNLLEVGDSAATHKMNIAVIDSLERFKPMYNAMDVFDKIDTTIVRTAAMPFLYPMGKGVKRIFKASAKYIQSSLVTAAATKDPLTRGMYEITLDAMKEAEDSFNKRVTELKMAGKEIPEDLYSVFEDMAVSNTRQALNAYEATLGVLRNSDLVFAEDISDLYSRMSEALSLATNGKVTDPGTLRKFFMDVLEETPTLKGSLSELTDLLKVVDDIAELYSKDIAVESAYKATYKSAEDIIDFFSNSNNTITKIVSGKEITYRSIKMLDPLRRGSEALQPGKLYRYVNADVPVYTAVKNNTGAFLNNGEYVLVDPSDYFKEVNSFLNGTIKHLINNAEALAAAKGVQLNNGAIDYLKQVKELLGTGGDKVKILHSLDIDQLERAMFDASDFYEALSNEHSAYTASFKDMNARLAALGKGMQSYHTYIGRIIDKYQVNLSVSLEDTLVQRGKVLEDTIQKIIDSNKYIDSVNESLKQKLTLIKNPDGTYNAEAVNEFCSDLATALDIKIQAIKEWQSDVLFLQDAREGIDVSGRALKSSEYSDSTIMSRLLYSDEEHILDDVDEVFLRPIDNSEALRVLNKKASTLPLPDVSDLVSSALTKGSGDSVQDVLSELTKLSDDLRGTSVGTKYFTSDPGLDIARIIPARTSRTMSMLYDPGFMEIAREIVDQSTVSHTLFNKQTIESFRSVQQLSDVADTVVDVYDFFDKLHRYQLVDNWLQTALINTGNETMVFQATMNALENMYHISPRQISENADTMAAFIHRVEANLAMSTRTQPVSLDHFRNLLVGEGFNGYFADDVFDITTLSVRDQKARAALIKVFEEHPELKVTAAHDALADAYFTEAVLRAMSPEDAATFDNLAKGSAVRIIDTETTMFSGRTGELLQFAGKTWGVDESLNLKVKYMPEEFTQAPDLEVLRTVAKSEGLSNAKIATMSEEELVNLYKSIFYSAQSEAERYTEIQLLTDALAYLEGSSKIIGANNKTFDNKFILDRLRELQYEQTLRTKAGDINPEQLSPLLQKFREGFTVEKFQDDLFNKSIDAQVLIAKKEGMVVLSAQQIKVLQAYCAKMGETLEGITSIRSIQPGLLQQSVKEAIKSLEEYVGDYSLGTTLSAKDAQEKAEGLVAYLDFFKRLDDTLTGAKNKDANQDVFNAMLDMRRGKYKYDNSIYIRDFVSEELSEADKIRYAKYGSESQAKLARTWQRLWELDPSYVKGSEVPESFKAAWLKEHNGVLPTSLYNVIRGSGETSGYGIKWVYREKIAKDFLVDTPKTPEFWEAAYKGAKRAHDMLDEGRLGNLRHVIGEDLLFRNSEDLLNTLKYMQQVGPSGTWWKQLDFDAMPNDALRFAYWKSINYDPRWRHWLKNLTPLEQSTLAVDPIKLGLDSVKDPAASFKLAMKNLGDQEIPESVLKHFTVEQTIIYRLTKLKEAEDVLDHLSAFRNWNIPGGANDYAARQAVAELEKGIAWLKKRPDRVHILREVERSEQAVRKLIADDFLAKSLEVDSSGKLTESAKEYLVSHLLFETPFIRVSLPVEGSPFKIKTNTEFPKATFLKHAEELNEIGVGIAKDTVSKEYILYLKGNAKDISLDFTGDVYKATFLGKQYTKPAFTLGEDTHLTSLPRPAWYEHDVDVQEFFDILDRARLNSLYFSAGTGVNTQGMFYKPFTQGSYRWFLDHARFAVPNDWVVTPELLYDSGYFNVPRFNSTGLLSFKALDDIPEPTFLSNPNIITHLLDQYNYAVRRTTDTLLYRDLYFNKEWGMHFDENGVFGEVIRRYGDKADEEIARAFRNSDGTFIVATLTEHKSKQGFRAIQIPIETAEDVAKARQLNAVILPYDVYSSSFNVINNASAAQRWFTKIPRMIVYMYKLGYLGTNMGTVFRNAIDSPFKVMVNSGRPIETMKYMHQATWTYKEFDDILARMFKSDTEIALSYTGFKKWFNSPDGKAFVAKNHYIKDVDTFLKIWGFFEDGPSAGEATSLIKYKRSKSMHQNRNFVKFVSEKMMAGMAYTEKISRLGQYLMMENAGYTKTQIFKSISDVQFDYNIKSDAMKVIEYFIPFFNFSKMNFEFWMTAIEKNPALVRILDDMLGSQQNAYDIDYENATMERSMLYHMMRGNILIDDNVVLKVNPSYMDAFNLLLEPINPAMAAMSGWNRYSTAYGLSTYLNNSNTLGNLIAPLKNLITSTIDEYTIEEKVTKVPFGKYKGLPVEEMLKDPLYMQQLMLSEFGKEKLPKNYPNVWKLMMQNMDKTDRLMYWGKYAGAPIREIMLEHPEYCQYMLSQDWFREQYKDLVDIFVANGLNNIPDVMPWGKYKGKSLDEVRADTNYLEYLNKDNWLQINQPLLYMALIEGKDTIIPESDLVLDTLVTKEQAEGLLSYGATLDAVAAENHFKNVMKNWVSDPTIYPLIGSIYTRFFSDSATSKRNEERLKNNSEAMRLVGKWFPGIFSATKRWNDNIYETSEAAYDSTRSFYRVDSNSYIPQTSLTKSDEAKITRYSKPRGSRNYSRASTYNRYKYNRGFRKYLRGSSDLLRLRLGIVNLHLF